MSLNPFIVILNIGAAFRGMHLSPVKHSYVWLPRKCDYRSDTQTGRETPDKVIPMCRYASQSTQKVHDSASYLIYIWLFFGSPFSDK